MKKFRSHEKRTVFSKYKKEYEELKLQLETGELNFEQFVAANDLLDDKYRFLK